MKKQQKMAKKNEKMSKKWRKLQQKAHVQPGSLKKEFLGYL